MPKLSVRLLSLPLGGALVFALIHCGGTTPPAPDSTGGQSGTGAGGITPQAGAGGSPQVNTGGTGGAGGGSPGTGGGGTTPNACDNPATTCGSATTTSGDDVIADFEDASGNLKDAPGRKGSFYTYHDATTTGAMSPDQGSTFDASELCNGGRCGSSYALHVTGSGFTDWGAGIGTDLAFLAGGDAGTGRTTFDATQYTGVAFWARIGNGATARVRFKIPDSNTDPDGGVCDKSKLTATSGCYNDWGVDLPIKAEWTRFIVPFSMLKQAGYGSAFPKFEQSRVFALQWAWAAGAKIDFWLDDIAFIK